jgi:hypothetical protein
MTVDEVIERSTLTGLILRLPPVQLDRKIYEGVKKKLEGIGGKWKGGKTAGFVFSVDPGERLDAIRNGEKVNLKQDYQFFATSDDYADRMVRHAAPAPYHRILEPSAGDGAIARAICRRLPDVTVDCFELMPENRVKLACNPAVRLIGEDFLAHPPCANYDRIIANPPFTRNQDIDHIRHMWACLIPGGRLVTLASLHWRLTDQRKHQEFRSWLDKIEAEQYDVELGAFKASGTSVGAVLIVADK